MENLFRCTITGLATMLPFTTDESWASRYGEDIASIHLTDFEPVPSSFNNGELAVRWENIRKLRRVVTGALEIERAEKRIGSSLEAAPQVYISDAILKSALQGIEDFEDLCITSSIEVLDGEGPADAFKLEDIAGVSVVPRMAEGKKCARSWRVSNEVGSDADYPNLTPRDAQAMRELK